MARILVIEDDQQIRSMISAVLASRGHQVQSTESAEQALRLCAQSGLFDLVLSDVVLPGMDGHEFVRRIASQDPAARVLLTSGYDPGCDICPYATTCPFLAKPFTIRGLLDAVNSCLSLSPPKQKDDPQQ